jgi:hypothetical protein
MIIDYITQTVPSIWVAIPGLAIAVLVVATYVDPELVEVYLGDAQFVVATLAVAVALFALVTSHPFNAPRQEPVSVPQPIGAQSP